jgi:hypothetical protein
MQKDELLMDVFAVSERNQRWQEQYVSNAGFIEFREPDYQL